MAETGGCDSFGSQGVVDFIAVVRLLDVIAKQGEQRRLQVRISYLASQDPAPRAPLPFALVLSNTESGRC